MSLDNIIAAIRDVPDFPKPGIVFKDITPVLADPGLYREVVDIFTQRLAGRDISKIAAIDARGFLFGGAIARNIGAGLVPVRKKGKLPFFTYDMTYDLEYGSATLSIHRDAFVEGDRVALVDDLLATGGTAAAAAALVGQAGGRLVEIDFLVELSFLNGRDKLADYEIFAPVRF